MSPEKQRGSRRANKTPDLSIAPKPNTAPTANELLESIRKVKELTKTGNSGLKHTKRDRWSRF